MATKIDIKKSTVAELVEMSDKKEEKIVNLKIKHSQGKLRNTAQLAKEKRDLARIYTTLNQKAKKLNE